MARPTETTPAVAGQSQLFIVRMWKESGHGQGDCWRGSAEHVPSRQRLYFSALTDLNDFISLRLNLPSATAAARDGHID